MLDGPSVIMIRVKSIVIHIIEKNYKFNLKILLIFLNLNKVLKEDKKNVRQTKVEGDKFPKVNQVQ